jgi:5-methylthioadenosine/S-adenosylhomocysteine deaminase
MPGGVSSYVLEGRVVTMNGTSDVLDPGRLYVRGPRIEAVARAGDPAPDGYGDAPLVRTGGTIYPGLIELHNHLPYNVLPMWQAPRRYSNRSQWGSANVSYRARVSGPMGVLGRVAGYIEAVVRYVEVKSLLGGVTTSQGIALYSNANRRIYQGLVRNVEQPGSPGLPRAESRVEDVAAQFAAAFLDRLHRTAGRTLLLHLGEGVDDVARAHFRALRTDDGRWAITNALAGIHCTGLRGRDFATFRSRGGTMVWSPLSNLLLYGQTTDVARAVKDRLLIGLGSDWSPSGSKNLLGEMKVAWLVAQEQDAGLSPRDIVAMATINGAQILKWDHALGSIEPNKLADLVVVNGRGGDPYEHLLRARETSITLVIIDGDARYGQPRMMQRLAGAAETFSVGGSARTIDLTDAATDPVVGALSLADARDRLADGMRRLPELARSMEQPAGPERLQIGASSAAEPGTSWFLELDHEPMPGFSVRPQLPIDGVATGIVPEVILAAPLSEVVQPVDLDPLTVADDREFFDRLAEARNLPPYILRELPLLYGQRSREPTPPVAAAKVVSFRRY